MKRNKWLIVLEVIVIAACVMIFGVPFYFILLTAMKNAPEAALMNLEWPGQIMLWENIREVFEARNYMLGRAFLNSTLLTVFSIVLLVIVSSMAAFVLQRRNSRTSSWIMLLIMAGLIIPPAVVPTIWVLEGLGLFKTLSGLISVEVAIHFSFCVLLYKAFIGSIPKEVDEAAVVDGVGGMRLFFNMILPLLKPVTATIVVIQAVTIFNDFTHPLYFLPGSKNVTVQLTLYNFTSQYVSQWNLLFANALLITIPPLVLFLFFNKKIVAGMTAGAVKG